MNNIELKDIPAKLAPLLSSLRRYVTFIFIIVLLGVYGFLVFQINALNSQEPADDAVTEKLNTVQRPRIDQNALTKIQQLESQNIDVQTLFEDARNNPFTE